MKIAILSDIHDNLENLEKCLSWCKSNTISTILLLGDLSSLDTLSYISKNFSGDIFSVEGNAELYENNKINFSNFLNKGDLACIKIDNLKIGLMHQAYKIKNLISKHGNDFDFIFHGHSHKPWIKTEGKTIIANPGNIAGMFYQASFAVLDTKTKKLDLKILNIL